MRQVSDFSRFDESIYSATAELAHLPDWKLAIIHDCMIMISWLQPPGCRLDVWRLRYYCVHDFKSSTEVELLIQFWLTPRWWLYVRDERQAGFDDKARIRVFRGSNSCRMQADKMLRQQVYEWFDVLVKRYCHRFSMELSFIIVSRHRCYSGIVHTCGRTTSCRDLSISSSGSTEERCGHGFVT